MNEAVGRRFSKALLSPGLRLLCLLYKAPRGMSRSVLILTHHRRAPFRGPSGRYPQAAICVGSVSIDMRGLPEGPGIYLRYVPVRPPRAEVLARCSWRRTCADRPGDGTAEVGQVPSLR